MRAAQPWNCACDSQQHARQCIVRIWEQYMRSAFFFEYMEGGAGRCCNEAEARVSLLVARWVR